MELFPEITPEQEAEYNRSVEEAQVKGADIPVDLTRPKPSEAFATKEAKKAEKPQTEAKKEESKADAADAVKEPAEAQEETVQAKTEGQSEEDWFESLPDKAKNHIRGLRGSITQQRKAKREIAEELEKRTKLMTENVRKMLDDFKASQQPKPDPVLDPDGYKTHLEQENKAKTEKLQTFEKATEQQSEVQDLLAWQMEQVEEFAQEKADFSAAETYAYNHAVKSLVDNGDADEENAREIVNESIRKAAKELKKRGGNIAKWVYGEAVKRGYKPAGQQVQAQQTQEQPQAKKGSSDADSITRGQKAAQSLGKGSAAASENELTWEKLSSMHGEDFEKAYNALIRKEMGLGNSRDSLI